MESATAVVSPPEHASTPVDLALEGMTCAACAARIEKALNRVPGVVASVNFATESAPVRYDPGRVNGDALLAAVARAGYRAHIKRDADAERRDDEARRRKAYVALKRELIVAVMLTLPL